MSGNKRRFVPYIPESILALIFLQSPAKSLIRFQSVSKSWKSLITSQHFISDYNTHQQQLQQQSLATKTRTLLFVEEEKQYISLWREDQPFKRRTRVEWPIQFTSEWEWPGVVGCCGGLVCHYATCYRTGQQRVFVWNPSINRWVQVPDEIGYDCEDEDDTGIGVGLAFDSLCDDYKVVSFILHFDTNSNEFDHKGRVYSVREGWLKRVAISSTAILPSNFYVVNACNYVFTNGYLNWVVKVSCRQDGGEIDREKYHYIDQFRAYYILRFDVHDEVFDAMPSPIVPIITGLRLVEIHAVIGEIKGCLSLFHYDEYASEDRPECSSIWRMAEYGVAESWTKLHDVEILNWRTSGVKLVIVHDVSDDDNVDEVLYSKRILPASIRGRVDAYLFSRKPLDTPLHTYGESLILCDGSKRK